MKLNLSKLFGGVAVAALTVAGVSNAAQAYPDGPVTLVVPYGAGGATDRVSRLFSNHLAESGIGDVPLTVVNRTGAGGVTGSAFAHAADPDGYTLLMARIGSHSVSPAMKEGIPYEYDDFSHMHVIELNPVICAVNPTSPIEDFQDLIDTIQETPGRITYSSSGVGSMLHIAGVLAIDAAGVEDARNAVIHVPFDGGGNAAAAVVTNNIGYICTNSSALAGHIASDALRPLMITIPSDTFPDIPTAESLGYPELANLVGWSAISGPPGLPQEVRDYWAGIVDELSGDDAWKGKLEQQGSVPAFMSTEESAEFITNQYTLFRELVDKLEMRIR